MKGYTTFTVLGQHPLLHIIRDRLILSGYALVQEHPDFLLIGALPNTDKEFVDLINFGTNTDFSGKVLVLSSGAVYSDRALDLTVRDKAPMNEADPLLIPSSLEPSVGPVLSSMYIENLLLTTLKQVLVLRVFDVYGKDVPGLVAKFIGQAKQSRPLTVHSPGYQTRTFLYLDDFLECFDLVLPKFLQGAKGIYNIGHTEEISIKRLADSVWQLIHGAAVEPRIEIVQPPHRLTWWKLPDTTRIRAWAKWKPSTTVRRGLWQLVQEK